MNDPNKMAILHCCYGKRYYGVVPSYILTFLSYYKGSGALASPFVATQFAKMTHFSYHYFTTLGLVFVALSLLISVFQLRTQNGQSMIARKLLFTKEPSIF